MTTSQRPIVRWPQLLLLACILILGITVPLTWQRRHAQNTAQQASLISPSAPIAQLPLLAGRAMIQTPEFAAAERPPQGLQPVPPSPAEPPGNSIATLIVNDPAADLLQVVPSHLENNGVHSFRHDAEFLEMPPLFAARAWPLPEALNERFAVLDDDPQTRGWSHRVQAIFGKLTQLPNIGHEDAPEFIEQLQAAINDASAIADESDDTAIRYHLNGVAYDVARRVDLWRAAHALAVGSDHVLTYPIAAFSEAALVGDLAIGQPAGTETINVAGVLAGIEQYEYTRLGHDAAKIATVIEQLENSDDVGRRQLAEQLDMHYRNANLRIAARGDLFNRLIPGPQSEEAPVDDYVLGIPVSGKSKIQTRLYTRLIPDPNRIRIGMEAWGNVYSDTTATSGPAQIFSQGETAFLVRKLILVDHEGVKVKRTVSEANSDSEMVGVATSYDGVPVVGPVVRNVVRRKADERYFEAKSVTEQMVCEAARTKFDEQIIPQMNKAIADFKKEVWTPLEQLGLEPAVVRLSTSETRTVGRLRVGGSDQLAAHTARPRALSDSLISFQLHESAMNNALAQFELDGQTLSLHDLYLRISKKLQQEVKEVPEGMPDNVVIRFAPRDAIRVRCDEGMLQLTLALTEVSKGAKYRWSNLTVRANYQIELDGMQANLVRSGSIELEGKRLRTRDQIALRGVFSKILSRSNTAQLVPDKLISDPRLANLQVTQRIIEGGWIGIAIGPTRPSSSLSDSRLAKLPADG